MKSRLGDVGSVHHAIWNLKNLKEGKLRLTLFIFICSLMFFSGVQKTSAEQFSKDEIWSIALEEESHAFGGLVFDYLSIYGTEGCNTGSSDLASRFGPLIQVYAVDSAALNRQINTKNFQSILIPTNKWLVPKKICGKYMLCLDLSYYNDEWHAGGSLSEFGEVIKPFFEDLDSDKARYVANGDFYMNFMLVNEDEKVKVLFPMNNYMNHVNSGMPTDERGLYDFEDVFPSIMDMLDPSTRCSSYNEWLKNLHIPCVEIGHHKLWVNLKLIEEDPLRFELTNSGPAEEAGNCVYFHDIDKHLNMGCVKKGDVYFGGSLKMISEDPVIMEVIDVEKR